MRVTLHLNVKGDQELKRAQGISIPLSSNYAFGLEAWTWEPQVATIKFRATKIPIP